MSLPSYRAGAAFAAAVIALAGASLAGCAQYGGTLSPLSNSALVQPDRKPPKCKGQQNEQDYATITETLSTTGGSFCIPEYGGFGGTVKYPSMTKSIQLTVSSGTTNFDNFPTLGSGSPIFYLGFSFSGGTTFESNLKKGGGLTAHAIVAGQPYTAYAEATILGQQENLGSCYTTATKGRYGGVIGGIGGLIKGQRIPFAVSGVIEIYSGQATDLQC